MSRLRNNGVFLLFLLCASLCAVLSFVSADFSTHLGDESVGQLKDGIVGEVKSTLTAPNEPKSPLLLARHQTKRPDILRMFKIYECGWNISSYHYWTSVGFTGAAGFVISILWFFSFGIALILHHFLGWKINFRGKSSPRSQKIQSNLCILFLFASLVGSVMSFVGSQGFTYEKSLALNYIVNQSDFTAQMLRNVTSHLTLDEAVDVPQLELPQNALKDIYDLRNRPSFGADKLTAETKENMSAVCKLLYPIILALFVCGDLILFWAGLAGYNLEHQNEHPVPRVFEWIFVAVLFCLLGNLMIVNSAFSDSCGAAQEWIDNPQPGTAMSDIFPCVDDRTSNQTLSESTEAARLLVNTVNTFINTSVNTERNQTGPLMPLLCFPFNDNMQDRVCSPQEVSLMDASLVWKKYKCMSSVDQQKCTTVGRLTPGMYIQLAQTANLSYALLRYTPTILNLEKCNFVRETVMTLNSRFCPHLKRYVLISVVGLGVMATAKMLNLVLWLVYSDRSLYDVIVSRRGNAVKVVPET